MVYTVVLFMKMMKFIIFIQGMLNIQIKILIYILNGREQNVIELISKDMVLITKIKLFF